MEILYIIIAFIIGICVCIPKMRKVYINTFDQQRELIELKHNISVTTHDLDILNKEKKSTIDNLNTLKEQNKNAAEMFYNQFMDNVQIKIENETEKISAEFQKAKEEYEQDYLTFIQEFTVAANAEIEGKQNEINELNDVLQEFKQKRDVIISAHKREEELKIEADKYKIILTEEDLNEIKKIREVIPFLRNSRPVNKIIWESYYRTPTNDLINRLLAGKICGIYLIENNLNKKTYVGQSNNISERWKQHIKCGLGIDTPNNILYKAMIQDGVENFSFELLEEVPQEKLNEREKYWIEYYQSDNFGYNMTSGG